LSIEATSRVGLFRFPHDSASEVPWGGGHEQPPSRLDDSGVKDGSERRGDRPSAAMGIVSDD